MTLWPYIITYINRCDPNAIAETWRCKAASEEHALDKWWDAFLGETEYEVLDIRSK